MHPTSQAIKAIIDATPGYSVDVLIEDLKTPVVADKVISTNEAAKRLGVCRATIWNLSHAGKLNPIHVGSSRRILRFKESEIAALQGV